MSHTFITAYGEDITVNRYADNNVIECWTHNALEQQIRRGSNMRKEKLQQYPRVREYNPINVDVIKMKREKKRRYSKCKYKIRCRNYNDIHSGCRPSNFYSNSHLNPKSAPVNSGKMLNIRLKNKYNRNNCPMRIAELATPTKRRCIETWKEKYDVLPDFIVERLKKYVMNQIPIVQIPEAIYCFKKARTSTAARYNNKKKVKDTKKCTQSMEIKTLSIIFGHEIAHRLIEPKVVKLNSRLTKLSEVVANDIACLMPKKTKCCTVNKRSSVIMEMANKVTLWMAMILEDSSIKLLEDTLEDLEDEEGPVLDCIDNLLEIVLDICEPNLEYPDFYNSRSETSSQSESFDENISTKEFDDKNITDNLKQDSEEDTNRYKQEDDEKTITSIENYIRNHLIDTFSNYIAKSEDQINKNLNTSKSQTSQNELSRENELADDIDSNIVDSNINDITLKQDEIPDQKVEHTIDLNTSMEHIGNLDAKDVQETKKNEFHIQKADSNIANKDLNVTVDLSENDIFVEEMNSEIELPKNNEVTAMNDEIQGENVANTELVETINIDENDDHMQKTGHVVPKDINLNIFKVEEKESDENNENVQDVIQKTEKNKHNQNNDSQDPKDLIITEIFEIPSEDKNSEEIADDKNKKVKFSNTDLVTEETLVSKKLSDTELKEHNINYEQKKVSSHPSVDIIKSTISFSAPNEELLSDADELWPKNIPSPIMRPSESVSRSITSLGRIMESDENAFVSPDSITEAIMEESIELLAQSHSKQKADDSESIEKTKNTRKETLTPHDAIIKEVDITSQVPSVEIPSTHEDTVNIETKATDSKKETPRKKKKKLAEKVKVNRDQNKTDRITHKKKLDKSSKSPTPKITIKSKQLYKKTAADSYNIGKTKEILQESKNKFRRKSDIKIKQNSKLNPVEINGKLSVEKHNFGKDIITRQSINKIISSHYVYSKPDYRVNTSTAPTWVSCSDYKDYSRKNSKKDYYTRKWCNDLYIGFEHLEIWRDWINIICESILIHKPDRVSHINYRGQVKNWMSLKKNIDNEAHLWRELNRHTRKKLRHIIYICKKESEVIPTVCCSKCCW